MNIPLPATWYSHRLEELKASLAGLQRKRRYLGGLRLAAMVATLLFTWYTWTAGAAIVVPGVLILLVIFFFAVSLDLKNTELIKNTGILIRVNEQELQALEHNLAGFPDGASLEPEQHDYANDLDIFGRSSLFQYVNRCSSEQGNRLLANWLLSPAANTTILDRQAAVAELAGKARWRQQLQAHGIRDSITLNTEEKISRWLSQENRFIIRSYWKWMQFILPALSILSLLLHLAGVLGTAWFYSLVFIFFILSFYITRLVTPEYRQLNRIASEMATLSNSIRHIENESFQAELALSIQKEFGAGNYLASRQVRQLKSILDRLDYRLNPLVFIPLNTFLFWDLQQVMALEKWKEGNKQKITLWFAALAGFEALASLANLRFNHPGWSFPRLVEEEGVFAGEELGHPLIPDSKRVTSSFNTRGPAQISLITGSNMAGKSTFLRSVGVNIVLAMTGGPVCAKNLTLSHFKVISSMRVTDNLEESTSTFYAELKKLKHIIESVNRKEKLMLLLDEILRGTNSADRHTGSEALIRQLIHHGAVGLVATHDLELAKLENHFQGQLHNYHFDVQVAGDELYFDYQLKDGVCRSMNASLLMKKIGIEL